MYNIDTNMQVSVRLTDKGYERISKLGFTADVGSQFSGPLWLIIKIFAADNDLREEGNPYFYGKIMVSDQQAEKGISHF